MLANLFHFVSFINKYDLMHRILYLSNNKNTRYSINIKNESLAIISLITQYCDEEISLSFI